MVKVGRQKNTKKACQRPGHLSDAVYSLAHLFCTKKAKIEGFECAYVAQKVNTNHGS
jgi:hypothetical protein